MRERGSVCTADEVLATVDYIGINTCEVSTRSSFRNMGISSSCENMAISVFA